MSALTILGPAACRAQDCRPFWSSPGVVAYSPYPYNINELAVFDDGSGPALYACSGFEPNPNGYEFDPVRRWRGSSWERVGPGQLFGYGVSVSVLTDANGPGLYATGYTDYPQSPTLVPWYKRWNGTIWVDPPPGLFPHFPFQPGDAEPYFSGVDAAGPTIFGAVYPNPSSSIMWVSRWEGAGWAHLGPLMFASPVFALFDSGSGPQLYLGSDIYFQNGAQLYGIARWNGQAWEGAGTSQAFSPHGATDMRVFDDGTGPALYIACGHPGNGTIFDEGIARWNGQQWSSVGGGISGSPNSSVGINRLAVFDDGSGPALFAVGGFSVAGGVPVRNIAKWDGRTWSALGAGIGAYVKSFAVYDDPRGHSLFAAGDFIHAGAGQSPSIAQWVGCPNCYANCDNSTQSPRLNILDFTCFLNKFAARDPYANCNVDATIDLSDFLCFLNKFAAGCP